MSKQKKSERKRLSTPRRDKFVSETVPSQTTREPLTRRTSPRNLTGFKRLPSFNQPYWAHDMERPFYPNLSGIRRFDVAVIGGGITGATTALKLRQSGMDVALIEMNQIGGGTSGCSTGHLDWHIDQSLAWILGAFGEEGSRHVILAKRFAVDQIEKWVNEFAIDCDFQRIPAYQFCENESDLERLSKEFEAVRKLGILAVEREDVPLPFQISKGILMPGQARFNTLKYVVALVGELSKSGGEVFENSCVKEIEDKQSTILISTSLGKIECRHVVMAGHAPLTRTVLLQMRSFPYQSYVIGVRLKKELTDGLYWDTADPYHYLRVASSNDPTLLIAGGANHHTGEEIDTKKHFTQLEDYVRARFNIYKVEYRWSHELFETADGLPYIGKLPGSNSILVATGFGGDSKDAIAKIPKGEGQVLRVNGEHMAIYRDEDNQLSTYSAVCRHLGCIVHWNSAEKSWDCPCHGGRYDTYGQVVAGPPVEALVERSLMKE